MLAKKMNKTYEEAAALLNKSVLGKRAAADELVQQ
jgi:hypothetical protein